MGEKEWRGKKKKGGTKDVIAVSIEKIQDIFARPISMIFFFFFFSKTEKYSETDEHSWHPE